MYSLRRLIVKKSATRQLNSDENPFCTLSKFYNHMEMKSIQLISVFIMTVVMSHTSDSLRSWRDYNPGVRASGEANWSCPHLPCPHWSCPNQLVLSPLFSRFRRKFLWRVYPIQNSARLSRQLRRLYHRPKIWFINGVDNVN